MGCIASARIDARELIVRISIPSSVVYKRITLTAEQFTTALKKEIARRPGLYSPVFQAVDIVQPEKRRRRFYVH